MAATLVWIADATCNPMTLSCGHDTRGNGEPTRHTSQPPQQGEEWWCWLCAMPATPQLDQELGGAAEHPRRDE